MVFLTEIVWVKRAGFGLLAGCNSRQLLNHLWVCSAEGGGSKNFWVQVWVACVRLPDVDCVLGCANNLVGTVVQLCLITAFFNKDFNFVVDVTHQVPQGFAVTLKVQGSDIGLQ